MTFYQHRCCVYVLQLSKTLSIENSTTITSLLSPNQSYDNVNHTNNITKTIDYFSAPVFHTSVFGNRMLILSSFKYSVHKIQGPSRTRWRCTLHWRQKCLAAVFTENDVVVRLVNGHNHPPQLNSPRKRKKQNKKCLVFKQEINIE